MAECPKCHEHLRLLDWKQHCPHCGANIFVYDLQERLMQEADIAEVQNYHFQRKIDRLKASFIGSKLAITRIVTSLIPVAAVALPLVNAKTSEALKDFAGGISAITIANNADNIGDEVINGILGNPLLIASIACFALSVVAMLFHLILLTLACSPKGKIRNFILDGIILATTIAAGVLFMCVPSSAAISGTLGIGGILYIVLQIVNVVIDFLTFKKGIEVKHKEAFVGGIPVEEYLQMVESGMPREEIRAEQYRRLQARQEAREKELAEKEASKNGK